jgi:hypothetical protein
MLPPGRKLALLFDAAQSPCGDAAEATAERNSKPYQMA